MPSSQGEYSGGNLCQVIHMFGTCRGCLTLPSGLQFIFSTAIDGKIKAWLYDNHGSRVDYDAPGQWCTSMAYSADGTRYARTKLM